MLGSNWFVRWGTLCGVFAMLLFVVGCPVPDPPVSCDDENPCTEDGNFCNGVEACVDGFCASPGTPCAEGETCDEDTDECYTACPTEGECDDEDACTNDSCGDDDRCVFAAVDCGDDDECTTDTCDTADGCAYADVDCDDGDACTADSCDAATGCANDAIDNCCETSADCAAGEECNADNQCEATSLCAGVTCDDASDCTDDSCDEATGECVYANNTAACDDGDACTDGDACADGACAGTAIDNCCETDADCTGTEICNADSQCEPENNEMAGENADVPFSELEVGETVSITAPDPTAGTRQPPADCTCTWSADGAGTFDPNPGCTTDYTPALDDTVISVTVDCSDIGFDPVDFSQDVAVAEPPPVACTAATVAADCLEGTLCTVDTCENDVCVYTPVDCGDDDLCTTDTCDPADGSCTSDAVVCDAGFACDAATGDCVEVPCTEDAFCDDTLFCNGAETCDLTDPDNGVCVAGTDPCPEGSACDEDTDGCTGDTLTLTVDDDVITGTAGDDVITGTAGTFNDGDIIVGNGGDDTLNVTIVDMTGENPTVIAINTVNVTTLVDSLMPATNFAAVGTINVDGTGGLNVTALAGGTDYVFGMASGYDDTLNVDLVTAATTSGEIALTLGGTDTNAVFDFSSATGNEDLAITVNAASTLNSVGAPAFGANIQGDVTITGTGALTLADFDDADLNTTMDIDATGLTGTLTLTVPDAGNGETYDFSAGGDDEILGIDAVSILDNDTQDYVLTFDSGDTNIAVDISEIDDADLAGNLTVVFGAGVTDTLTVTLGGDGGGMGHLTANTTEFITINSTGTDANAIGNLVQADTAFVGETVDIIGDQDLTIADLSGAAEYVVDAGTFTGDLTITVGSAQADSITGGSGDDDLNGDASTDEIDGGAGDDTITGGDGQDLLTGGTGVDTFVLDDDDAVDSVTDFTPDTDGDVVSIDVSALNTELGQNLVDGNGDIAAGDAIVFEAFASGGTATIAATDNIMFVTDTTGINSTADIDVSNITLAGAPGNLGDRLIIVWYDANDARMTVSLIGDGTADTDLGDTPVYANLMTAEMTTAEYATLDAVNFLFD